VTKRDSATDIKNAKAYFYVESVKPRPSMSGCLQVSVSRLSRSDAIKKAEIHEKLMDHLSMMSEKRSAISSGNYSELLKWRKEFNHRKRVMTKLYKRFFSIDGPREVLFLSLNEALDLCPGMVLRGDFIKDEIIDDSGMVKVSRHNFYRWTIVY
jgi:hypothetical protein